MKTLSQVAALLRHLRSERGVALALVTIVVFTAFVLASVPRLYNQTLDDELRYRIEEAPASWRNLSVTMQRRSSVEQDETILERLDAGGAAYLEELEPTLQEVIVDHGARLDSPRSPFIPMRFGPPLTFRRSLQFRYQTGVEGQVTLKSGRWPVAREPVLLSDLMSSVSARGEVPYPRYEIALTQASLEGLDLKPFDWFLVRLGGTGRRALVQVVGVIQVNDPAASYWNSNGRLHEPVVSGFATDFGEVVEATALAAPDAYPGLLEHSGNVPWDHAWIFYVDSSQLNVANYAAVSTEIRLLKATRGPIERLEHGSDPRLALSEVRPQITFPEFDPTETTIHNEIPLILERFAGQARLTSSVIAIQTIGILAVGLSAIGLFAALIAGRRRAMVTLIRGRGASRGQLVIAQIVEGIVLCVPASLFGLVLALQVIDARSSTWSVWAALATAVLATALLLAGSWTNVVSHLGALIAGTVAVAGRRSLRRVVMEIAIVGLALVGILLIRQRGFEPGPDETGIGGFDPFLAAVPVLLALAVGIITARLFPLPVKSLAWLSRWLRGSVLFVGLRWMAGQPAVAYLPMVAMLLTVGVSITGAIINNSVDRAQQDYAWRQVRSDYRVDGSTATGSGLAADLNLAGIAGVEVQAREFRSASAEVSPAESSRSFGQSAGNQPSIDLIAIEPGAYSEVIAGTSIATRLPARLDEAPAAAPPGSLDNPLPAVLSTTWPERSGERPRPGDVIQVNVSAPQFDRAVSLAARIIELRDEVPALTGDGPFLVVGWESFLAAVAEQHPRPLRPTSIYVDASDVSEDALQAAIREQIITPQLEELGRTLPVGVSTVSRAEVLGELRDAPLARGLRSSFVLSAALAAGYAVLAIIIALVLESRSRARDIGFLRTMGQSRAQTFLVGLVETVPAIVAGGLIGVGLGLAIARLVEPGIDLTAFAGPEIPVDMVTDWTAVALIAGSIVAAAVASVLVFSALARRVRLGDVLRLGGR